MLGERRLDLADEPSHILIEWRVLDVTLLEFVGKKPHKAFDALDLGSHRTGGEFGRRDGNDRTAFHVVESDSLHLDLSLLERGRPTVQAATPRPGSPSGLAWRGCGGPR